MNCKPGGVFGRLTMLGISEKTGVFLCVCGNVRRILISSVKSGNTKSCGCLQRDEARRIGRSVNKSHGMTNTREYSTWQGMRERCNDPSNKSYKDYGARGIAVCDQWSSFEQFFKDMGKKPAGCSIDRRDNNGPYSKDNCYWATPKEQTRNRRNSIDIAFQGQIKPLTDWCIQFKCDYSTVHSRLFKHGWTFEQAITIPKNVRRPKTDIEQPIKEVA